jgi:hypothetical protein
VVSFAIITNFLLHGCMSFKINRQLWLVDCYVYVKIMTYGNIISRYALYGCVTWSLISKEEHRLRVFVNEVKGKVLGLRGKK